MGIRCECLGRGGGEEGTREVTINAGHTHKGYKGNYTSTTKYNLLTFLPKALFEQYRRVANIYFTIVAALSLTPYTPVRAWTTWTPLAIVLGVAMIKEAVEDYKRYKQDSEVNARAVDVLDPASKKFVTKRWQDVNIGDIVRVTKDQQFPADLVFLTSEIEEGTCYIETMNLDGETNLKIKKALDQTKDYRGETPKDNAAMLLDFKATVKCEGPNARLYQFTGNLELPQPGGEPLVVPLNPAAILLRGCQLRNTHVCYGAVIYAGHETKVFKNATAAPSKRSRIERNVDKVILFMFSLLFSFCITGCVYFAWWTSEKGLDNWYLELSQPVNDQYNPSKAGFVGFASFITSFILYGYLIPISLYVSMEMVKITQSMVFINRDRDMYHAETDTPALARTSNLNEELGMVNTILSDKTGTLTRNVMEFFKCSIAGVAYGAGITEIDRANALRRNVTLPEGEDPNLATWRERFFNFYDSKLMSNAWFKENDPATIEMFFRLLAVCHTVVPDGPTNEKELKYEAESPDEAALVVAAKVFGFFFFKRTNTTVTVRETGPHTGGVPQDLEYEVLNILEFNSTRKRMSVIVRDPTGRLLIFCKGADTVIYERLDHAWPANSAMKERTSQHMEEFGSAGLRTLCLSYTEIDAGFYDAWQARWVEAKTSLQDRDEKLALLAEEVEKALRLLGCTAIEDKLQEGVPQAIKQLAQAGIRIWVLTGDKMETAINIGFACSLLTEDMHQSIISAYSKELDALEVAGKKDEAEVLCNQLVQEQLAKVEEVMDKHAAEGSHLKYAIIIEGKALSYAMSAKLRAQFLRIGLRCKSVICCRVSPLQKAQVTELVRSHGDTTLAIGDGANDVGMIQKAHIGVGISGQEGMQAVMSADFAIAQFRFLVPLLLVHGRYSYKRISRMVLFFFYKNMLFGVSIFIFNALNGFSGQFIYNDFYMTLYNVVFTALTPLAIGMFDRDVDKDMCLKYPGLYRQGQRNDYFGFRAISIWLISSLYQTFVVFFFVVYGCSPLTSDRAGGQPYSMWQTGVVLFSVIIITVHLQVVQVMEQWTWLHHLAIWLSQLVWWLYLLAYGAFPISLSTDLYNLFAGIVAPSAQYWFYLLMTPLAAQMPDFFCRCVQRLLYPEDHQIVQEIQLRMKREHVGALPEEAGMQADSSVGQNMLNNVLAEKATKNRNRGFVPPYDAKSKFYGLLSSAVRVAGRNETSARNPVLNALDESVVTNNPMRAKKKPAVSLPSVANGNKGGKGSPGAVHSGDFSPLGGSAGGASNGAAQRAPLPPLVPASPSGAAQGVAPFHSQGSDTPAAKSERIPTGGALGAGQRTNGLPPLAKQSQGESSGLEDPAINPNAIASPAGDMRSGARPLPGTKLPPLAAQGMAAYNTEPAQ